MPIASNYAPATLQFNKIDTCLRDDQSVDLVYGAIVSNEFKVRIEKAGIPIRQNVSQEFQGFAFVGVS
jgi:hypothetical protein